MIRVIPFANALALVTVAMHVLGALFALLAPGSYLALLGSWLLLDLSSLGAGGVAFTLAGFVVGLATAALAGWLFGLVLAALYNLLSGEGERA